MQRLELRVSLVLLLPLTAVAEPAGVPNAQLLPTTRAIHAKISAVADPAAATMQPYAEAVPKAKGAQLQMLPIAAGTFLIGSPDAEAGRKPNEGPQRKLAIEPFWIGKLEITWDLYRAFMESGGSRNKDGTLNRDADQSTSEPPAAKGEETLVDTVTQPTPPYTPMHFGMADGYSRDFPAVGMTQHAANKFCEWLSAQTGHFYRLPTEAEWEYACRAGTTTAWSFGDDPSKLTDHAWFADNSEFQYQKVGTKKPNPWGVHDMHGNVAEHVLDQYVAEGYAAIKEGAAGPLTPAVSRYPTSVRGGHWDADPAQLRSAARVGSVPAWKARDPQLPKSIWYFTNAPWLGFRVVRPLHTPPLEEMHRAWNMGPGAEE
jgi:formylglycine-generating enzyme required for sulfatase activity